MSRRRPSSPDSGSARPSASTWLLPRTKPRRRFRSAASCSCCREFGVPNRPVCSDGNVLLCCRPREGHPATIASEGPYSGDPYSRGGLSPPARGRRATFRIPPPPERGGEGGRRTTPPPPPPPSEKNPSASPPPALLLAPTPRSAPR